MPYGDIGDVMSYTRLIDYQVEGNEIIINGCIEGYEDEEREELLLLHNFTVYGEYNEKSGLGKFKLKKLLWHRSRNKLKI